MPDMMSEIFRLFGAVWEKGNALARAGIAIILIWPLVMITTAAIFPPNIAITVVPIVTIVCLILILVGPSKLAIIEVGLFRYVARIIVPFLLIGVYCSFIALGSNRGLAPLVALLWYVVLFLFWGGYSQWGTIAAILLLLFSFKYFPGTLDNLQNLAAPTGPGHHSVSAPDDGHLADSIKSQLFSNPQTKHAQLQVSVKDSVATLSGQVPSDAARYDAFRIASQTPGVAKVIDQMTVQSPPVARESRVRASVDPRSDDVPNIASVQFSGSGKDLHIDIQGRGFGQAPRRMPHTGDLPDFGFLDDTRRFEAGHLMEQSPNLVTLHYVAWSPSEIHVAGFSGLYGSGAWVAASGDRVRITVSNPSSGRSATWAGVLP